MSRARIRPAVRRLAPLFLAVVLTLIFTSVALATLYGPVATPPGGVTITPSDPSGRQIGLAGGLNVVYSDFDFSQFENLYWGGPQGMGAVGFAFDGALDESGEIMTFSPGQSDLPNGMAMWTGQSDLTFWTGSGWATNYYSTRFTLRATDSTGNPIPMAIASNVGIPGPGPVITVTGNFTANLRMEVLYGAWQPCLAVYNGLNTTPPGGSVLSSFWDQFYYTTAGNASIVKEVTPSSAAPGDSITYTLSFSNTGTEILTGLVITDIVPVSITVQSIISSGAAITDTGAQPPYVWTVADLAIGQSGAITISGILTTPLAAGTLTNTVTATAANDTTEANNSSSISLTVTNVAPVAVDDIYTATEDIVLAVPAAAGLLDNDGDANGDPLTAGLLTAPPTGTVNLAASGAFTYTPELNFNGLVTFTYRVQDSSGLTDTAAVNVLVQPANDPPVLAPIGSKGVPEGTLLSFSATATDLDVPTNTLTFSLDAGAPPGTSIDPATGLFTWTPTEAQGPGVYLVTVRVTDDGAPPLDDYETIQITVNEVNQAPVLAPIGSKSVDESTLLSFTATATDADLPSNTLTYSLDTGAPPGAGIDPATGLFTWTPSEAQGPGVYPVTVRVTDDGAPPLDDYETIQITVNEVNQAPVLAPIGSKGVPEGTLLSFTATATDADLPPNTLTYSLDAGAPSGAGIDPSTGLFTWTPTEAQGPGVYPVTVRVTDNGGPPLDDYETIQITVAEVNLPPVAVDDGYSTAEDAPLVVAAPGVLGNDSDGDLPPNLLTAALDNGPVTGSLDLHADGSFVYTPTLNYNGVVTFTYYVDDGLAVSPSAVVAITVTPVCDCAVELTPPAAAQIGDVGTTVTYTLRLTNTGDCADVLDVTVDALWPTDAPVTVGPLAAGEGRDIAITVAIPAGAGDGDQDVATVTFTSQGDSGVSATSVLTTTANVPVYRVYAPLIFRNAWFGGSVRQEPGRAAIYPD